MPRRATLRRVTARIASAWAATVRAAPRGVGALAAAVLAAAAVPLPAAAQYFGRNKVNYETFDFRILRSPTFDTHFYTGLDSAAADAARMAERWYVRLSPFMRHKLARKSLIFFGDQPDFQQNNISYIGSEGTGGVTEGARQRVVMPFTGVYADFHHVLGHELVHVFQYDIAEQVNSQGGSQGGPGINALPLWLIEGMAEYLSLGRADVNTATWLRDAARRNDIPTVKQLTNDPRYFPYRYGQALWAYVGGRYGDQAVVDVYRTALRYGFEGAIRRVLDVSTEQFSKDWAAAIKTAYLPLIAGRTAPDSTATLVIRQRARRGGEYNTSPVVSPDGRTIAFFSSRGLFGIDLYVADAVSGRVIKQLGSINTPRHFDALSFISSAGTWSPDGRRLAYVVYREGDQVLSIYDLDRRRDVRTLRTNRGANSVGAALDPAWSPDGRYVAFAGSEGGISDLYLYDTETDRIERLTNDKSAQLQPQWSPDGRTLAFVTDAGPGTSFEALTFGPMRLATMDMGTRQVTLVDGFPAARHINPHWSPDGRALYFVADPDGFSDVYRLELASGALARLTRTSTGVAGITNNSPALSVARGTGRLVFSIFDRGGYNIARIDDPAAAGTPVTRELGLASRAAAIDNAGVTPKPGGDAPSGSANALGGVLPPVPPERPSVVERYLADATTGLPPSDTTYALLPYRSRLSLDYVAPPTVGAGYNPILGATFAGGVAAFFGDQLGDRQVAAVLQANGQIQDIGGQTQYINTKRRWNWGGSAGYIPIPFGFAGFGTNPDTGEDEFLQGIQRFTTAQASLFTQYPLSTTRRFELSASGTRQSIGGNVLAYPIVNGGIGGQPERRNLDGFAISFTQVSAALVGDYSINGFTSPIAGGRYRFDVGPTFGQLQFTNVTADYRRYFLARPVTFAFRGLHYGRYGRDELNRNLFPNYVGFGGFIRGYDVLNNFNPDVECADASPAVVQGSIQGCPIFARTLGSRMAVLNAELRIPLFGTESFGLFRTSFAPVEIAPFFDAGLAWSRGDDVRLKLVGGDAARTTPERVPMFSTGITARINLLGFAVIETFYAVPFQRPDRRGRFGFNLLPGW
jgi:dipeptidyl aminopeptidase/acylaminoacyl peptidase